MKPRTAIQTINIITAQYFLVNLGLSNFLDINIIVILDVIFWLIFNGWLNNRIRIYNTSHPEAAK